MSGESTAPELFEATDASGERTIPLPDAPLRLDVRNPNGLVEIVGRVRPDLLVAWTKLGDSSSPAWQQARMRIDARGADIAIAADLGPTGGRMHSADGGSIVATVVGAIGAVIGNVADGVRFDIRIEVPAALPSGNLTAHSASGQLRIAGVGAQAIAAHNASGSIDVEACGSDLRLDTASGRIALARVYGSCAARSASGPIDVLATRPLDLSAETASGSIRVGVAEEASGEARLRSVSGSISIAASTATPISVSTRTVSGRVSADPSFAAGNRGEWRSGDHPVVVVAARTVSGAVRLKRTDVDDADARSASASGQPTDPVAAAGDGTRHETGATTASAEEDAILRAVERGEIGVDEALRLLDQRDSPADDGP